VLDVPVRDYSLIGPEAQRAVERGLASAQWYACPVPRKQLKELMKRKDGPAARDAALWFALLLLSGGLGAHFWGSWWGVPCFMVYGVLYGSTSDSRWHEYGHGTAFRTQWLNSVFYQIASFMIFREPTVWRWSHTRHHTDTIIVGRDPEIAAARPPDLVGICLQLFGLKSGWITIKHLVLHVQGRIAPAEATFIPETERWKVFLVARIWVAIFLAVAVACVAMGSILPAMLIGLPSFYGAGFVIFFGLTQHAGLDEDVLDHRLNSRTVYMNPIFRFMYLNMNYHIEHHMFPMVPYYALPQLHEVVKADCPPAYPSTIAAYREIMPTLLRQYRDPTFFIRRELPAGARSVPAPGGAHLTVAAE
jgi:fatty acid desaturase